MRGQLFFIVIALAALLPASVAEACSNHGSSSTYATLPGGGLAGLSALPWIILLQGVLERPFVSWAGVERNAFWLSISGSAMAGLVVHSIGFIGWGMAMSLYTAGPLLGLMLVLGLPLLSWYIKSTWLNLGPLSMRLLPGTILSTLTLLTMPVWRAVFNTDQPRHIRWAIDNYQLASLIVVPIGLYLLIHALAQQRPAPFARPPRHAFEVIPITQK